jgi:AraC-like DNA-binding protein
LISTRPDVGFSMPEAMRSSVVLPLPDGPSRQTASRVERRFGTSEAQRGFSLDIDALLDATRFALARSYLADPALGMADVAWLTGYAKMATFYRAFRRWTGSTPGAYRARPA